jgi:hypothetical protein
MTKKIVRPLPYASILTTWQIQLCGLPPKIINDISGKAIEFYMYQKGTEHDYKVSKLERNEQQIQQLEKSYKERLVEAQNKIATLTHQYQVSKSDNESDKKELEELKEKYAEKAK